MIEFFRWLGRWSPSGEAWIYMPTASATPWRRIVNAVIFIRRHKGWRDLKTHYRYSAERWRLARGGLR